MFLFLDFTVYFCLALLDKKDYKEKTIFSKKNISEILILEIEKFFKDNSKNIKNLKYIYIITGPGSFTGVRSSITFAKILRLTHYVEIIGISKFQVLNFLARKNLTSIKNVIFIHYRGSEYFTQTFINNTIQKNPKLVDLNSYKFQKENNVSFIYENQSFLSDFNKKYLKNIREKSYFIEYKLNVLQGILKELKINKSEPKALYIKNYF